MIVNFYVPTVKEVLYSMDQVELDAIRFFVNCAYYPEITEDTKSMNVYVSVLDNMSYTKQKVAYYLIGKACDITG